MLLTPLFVKLLCNIIICVWVLYELETPNGGWSQRRTGGHLNGNTSLCLPADCRQGSTCSWGASFNSEIGEATFIFFFSCFNLSVAILPWFGFDCDRLFSSLPTANDLPTVQHWHRVSISQMGNEWKTWLKSNKVQSSASPLLPRAPLFIPFHPSTPVCLATRS